MATFALGAVTGAALVVLFTPRTGRAIRQMLRERLHTWRERVAAHANADSDELTRPSGAAKHSPVPAPPTAAASR